MNKQKLQEQIQTMRTELAKMETELAESEKVELKYHGIMFNLAISGSIDGSTVKDAKWKNRGLIRQTKELAEIASKNMVTRNKLEAYAHMIDPEWRDEKGLRAACIHKAGDKYSLLVSDTRRIGAVYMSIPTAETICEWLNDGRIEL